MGRRRKVQKVLEWLKQNNPAFSDITISQDRLQMLPENGELQDIHTLEYNSDNTHSHNEGPAPQQVDPGIIDGETN